MTFFWPEVGSGFGGPGGTAPPRISRSTPREDSESRAGKRSEKWVKVVRCLKFPSHFQVSFKVGFDCSYLFHESSNRSQQSPGGTVSQHSIRTSSVENGSWSFGWSDWDCSANGREGLFTTLGKHVLVSTERKMQEEARYLKRWVIFG